MPNPLFRANEASEPEVPHEERRREPPREVSAMKRKKEKETQQKEAGSTGRVDKNEGKRPLLVVRGGAVGSSPSDVTSLRRQERAVALVETQEEKAREGELRAMEERARATQARVEELEEDAERTQRELGDYKEAARKRYAKIAGELESAVDKLKFISMFVPPDMLCNLSAAVQHKRPDVARWIYTWKEYKSI